MNLIAIVSGEFDARGDGCPWDVLAVMLDSGDTESSWGTEEVRRHCRVLLDGDDPVFAPFVAALQSRAVEPGIRRPVIAYPFALFAARDARGHARRLSRSVYRFDDTRWSDDMYVWNGTTRNDFLNVVTLTPVLRVRVNADDSGRGMRADELIHDAGVRV